MRMPLLKYFVVVGVALLAALLYLSRTVEPAGPAFQTTQMVGLPPPFKAPPEVAQQPPPPVAQAEAQAPAPQAAKPAAAVARKHKAPKTKTKTAKTVPQEHPVPQDHYAQYPRDTLTAIR